MHEKSRSLNLYPFDHAAAKSTKWLNTVDTTLRT